MCGGVLGCIDFTTDLGRRNVYDEVNARDVGYANALAARRAQLLAAGLDPDSATIGAGITPGDAASAVGGVAAAALGGIRVVGASTPAQNGVNGGVAITPTVIEPKIAQQMGARGWSAESIEATIANPAKTVVTKDTRFDPISGTRLNDPATGYVAQDGSYVVRNDRTGQVVQVSNKTDPTWKAPWDK